MPETGGPVRPGSVEREGLVECAAREQQERRSVSRSSGERPGHCRDSVRQRECGTQGRVQTCRPPRGSAKRARGRGETFPMPPSSWKLECPTTWRREPSAVNMRPGVAIARDLLGIFFRVKRWSHVRHGDRRSDQEHRLFSSTQRVAEPVVCRTSWQFPTAFDSRIWMWLTYLRSVAWHRDCFTPPDAVSL